LCAEGFLALVGYGFYAAPKDADMSTNGKPAGGASSGGVAGVVGGNLPSVVPKIKLHILRLSKAFLA
jgi:hypothetical protein